MKLISVATLQLASFAIGVKAKKDCCWCDDDTPAATIVGSDSQVYSLVFSDEFNSGGRNFANGKDTKWTALKVGDTSNKGAAFYLPEQAQVVRDPVFKDVSALRILTENKNFTGDGPDGEKNIFMPYRSAMLQSWNKFCFTGGILEYKARQPRGGGYWPALWAFGNLGRAVFQNSNTGLWPWSYDKCDSDLELPPTDPPQRISACMDHDFDAEGLHPFQGRGATELDVLEGAVSNDGQNSYVVGSLQLSPGIPPYFRPPLFGFPTASGQGSWYTGLSFGQRGKPNNGWYGPPWGSGCPTGCPDALSGGLIELNDLDTRYWTYRMEWKLGPNGHLSWYYDDEFVWGISAASFGEYKICSSKDGVETCARTPARMIPQEPMSLVMNTAIGTWNGGQGAIDNKHWPAEFYIDYVRVWQQEKNIGCDPPDFPTKVYINKNAAIYGEPVSPLGDQTCPENYPPSAYANAEAIKARGAALRLSSKNLHAASAVLTLPILEEPPQSSTHLAKKASDSSSARNYGSNMMLPMLAAGAAITMFAGAYVWRSSKVSSYTPAALSSRTIYGELGGDYELAR